MKRGKGTMKILIVLVLMAAIVTGLESGNNILAVTYGIMLTLYGIMLIATEQSL